MVTGIHVMSGGLSRRIAAAEVRTGLRQPERLVVRFRPAGLTPAQYAAWNATEPVPEIEPDLTVTVCRLTIPWPPRSAEDAQRFIAARVCSSLEDVAIKVAATQ